MAASRFTYRVAPALLCAVMALAPFSQVHAQGAPAAPPRAPAAKSTGGDDARGLRQRVEALEEQLVDMQVVIGTLESLAKGGGGNSTAPRSEGGGELGGADRSRIDGLETQLRALTAQLEQLSGEVRALSNGQRRPAAGAGAGQFGSTTVTSGDGDPIGGMLEEQAPEDGRGTALSARPEAAPRRGEETAMVDPNAGGSSSARAAYDRAYGLLLQRDYDAAYTGFRDFLKRYPADPDAPNALYWLGETHFVQGNYSDAIEAFDLLARMHPTSQKAPDAQLKRGMALAQSGRRQDACTALRGVGANAAASASVKSKASDEMARVGCP